MERNHAANPFVLKHKGYITNIDGVFYASLGALSKDSFPQRITDGEFSQLQTRDKVEMDLDPKYNNLYSRVIDILSVFPLNNLHPDFLVLE